MGDYYQKRALFSCFLSIGLGTFLIILHGISSAAFDIYKYERGCEDWKGYRANLNRLDYLRNRLKELKDEINLAWVPRKFPHGSI